MIHLLEIETLKKWLANGEIFLIDVREPHEYNESHIEGSTLIPLDQLDLANVTLKNKDKRKIVIHCKSGGRSMRACKILIAADPTLEVYNVEGGITAWHGMQGSQSMNVNTGSCSTKCSI